MSLTLVGHFKGYSYFPGAMVEPSFVVLKANKNTNLRYDWAIKLLTAQEGAEDRALRLLRRGEEELPSTYGVEILHENRSNFNTSLWLPKSRTQVELLRKLSEANLSQVRDLFEVHQGVRTGNNEVFVLSQQQLAALPTGEHIYFRPLAGTKTISAGRVIPGQYIFYPYNNDGLALTSEEELKDVASQYYKAYLLPFKDTLAARSRINSTQWWRLTWERSWQWRRSPKLVTKYFGEAGSFAYDENGEYVIGQGFGWLWRTPQISNDAEGSEENEESEDDGIDYNDLAGGFTKVTYLGLMWPY